MSARGKRQHYRVAEPMGMLDMDENSFDNFHQENKITEIDNIDYQDFASGIMGGCIKQAAKSRFPSKKAKLQFLKDCMKGKKNKLKKSLSGSKKGAATKMFDKARKTKKKAFDRLDDVLKETKKANEQKQQRLANPDLIKTPESTSTPIPQTTGGKSKKLLYISIGVVALVVAVYIFKR